MSWYIVLAQVIYGIIGGLLAMVMFQRIYDIYSSKSVPNTISWQSVVAGIAHEGALLIIAVNYYVLVLMIICTANIVAVAGLAFCKIVFPTEIISKEGG